MTLQQLEAVCAIALNHYNISAAAQTLNRSQSGLSRQLKELEAMLGFQVFMRTRNKVMGLTEDGQKLLALSRRVLSDLKAMERLGQEEDGDSTGEIRVATTHVHARYLLPRTIKEFIDRFPRMSLTLQQCDPAQCRHLIASGEADVGIITMSRTETDAIVTVPVYRIPRCVIVPVRHPLAAEERLTLERLGEFPLIGYPASFSGRSIVEQAFAAIGMAPRVVCSATDADVCKAYVQLGMGVAVLATIAFDPAVDRGLVSLDASHLFQPGTLNLVFRRNGFLTRPLRAFLSLFAPHVAPEILVQAMRGGAIDRERLSQRAPTAVSVTAR